MLDPTPEEIEAAALAELRAARAARLAAKPVSAADPTLAAITATEDELLGGMIAAGLITPRSA